MTYIHLGFCLEKALAVDSRGLGQCYTPEFCVDLSGHIKYLFLECVILDHK
jgi:hypothetical protein